MRSRLAVPALILLAVLALGSSSCRREAPATAPPLHLRQLERAYLYLGGEVAPALVYEFPRDLADVAGLVERYERAGLGGPPSPAECRVRLVWFRRTLPPVTLEALEGGQVVVYHPGLEGPRQLLSAALWDDLEAAAAPARAGRAVAGAAAGSGPGPAAPRVIREHLELEPPASHAVLIALQFDRPMDWNSVLSRLSVSPPLAGVLSHQGESLLFFVSGYPPGGEYVLTVGGEATGAGGESLGADYRFAFSLPALEAATATLRAAVSLTLAGQTLAFERVAGAGAASGWLPSGTPPPVGAGATVFMGRYDAAGRVHYLYGDEAVTIEGYRDGARMWSREEVAGEPGAWTAQAAGENLAADARGEFLRDLLDPGRWGGLAGLAQAGVAVRLSEGLLGVSLPLLDARLSGLHEWDEGLFASYSILVRLGEDAAGRGPVVEEIACRLVYHRPDDVYPFSYFDDVSHFRVGEPVTVTLPSELGP